MRMQEGASVKKRAAGLGALGLAIAWGAAWQIPDLYVAQSKIQATGIDAEAIHASVQRALSRPRLAVLIRNHQLYTKERTHLPVNDVIEKMAKNVSVTGLSGDAAGVRSFSIGFAYPDAEVSQRVTRELVVALIRENAPGPGATSGPRFLSVDEAARPDAVYPNRPVMAFTGLLIGTLAGAAWGLLQRRRAQAGYSAGS